MMVAINLLHFLVTVEFLNGREFLLMMGLEVQMATHLILEGTQLTIQALTQQITQAGVYDFTLLLCMGTQQCL